MRYLAILSLLLFTSCSNRHHSDVGQYVYLDCINQLHIDRECASSILKDAKSKEERIIGSKGVVFVDTCELSHNALKVSVYPLTFCPRCIDDKVYTHLSNIMERNENTTTTE